MYDNDFNLDDILSEFSDSPSSEKRPSSQRAAQPVEESIPVKKRENAERRSVNVPEDDNTERAQRRPERNYVLQDESDYTEPSRNRRRPAEAESEKQNAAPAVERRKKGRAADIMDVELSPKGRSRQNYPEMDIPSRNSIEDEPSSPLLGGLLFLLVLCLISLFMLKNVHPNAKTVSTESASLEANLSSRFENLTNNLASDALSDITYIKKVYSIPEDASVAPKPDPACFGESNDPAVIQSIIDGASELLEGQEMVWNSDIVTFNNTPVQYYYDETILSLVWKEVVGNTVFTFSEIKIADGSQLRRSLAGDAYSSSIQLKASDMAATVNAVTAMNGDFYAFRQVGIVVYKRNLERFEPSSLDSCFFTSEGNMIFAHRGELTSEEDTRKFIEDNDIIFSTSFGPILVENGELYSTKDYPIGEIFTKYARSAIGMTGERHYLLMATSSEKDSGYLAGVYVSTAGEIMYNKGCIMAYELDGGQTAVIVHNNTPANEIVYGSERTMSDIIYFATAIPDGEG